MAPKSSDECFQQETVIDVGARPAGTYIHTVTAGLVALLVRLVFIDRQSFHVDELLDRGVAELGWAKIFDYADGFPPGYYYIEKAWITLFGSGSIRELALFVGMLGMGVYRRRRRPVVRHPHNACDRLGGGACTDARVAIERDATALDACHRNSSGPLDSGTTAGDAEPLESGRVRGHARRGRVDPLLLHPTGGCSDPGDLLSASGRTGSQCAASHPS